MPTAALTTAETKARTYSNVTTGSESPPSNKNDGNDDTEKVEEHSNESRADDEVARGAELDAVDKESGISVSRETEIGAAMVGTRTEVCVGTMAQGRERKGNDYTSDYDGEGGDAEEEDENEEDIVGVSSLSISTAKSLSSMTHNNCTEENVLNSSSSSSESDHHVPSGVNVTDFGAGDDADAQSADAEVAAGADGSVDVDHAATNKHLNNAEPPPLPISASSSSSVAPVGTNTASNTSVPDGWEMFKTDDGEEVCIELFMSEYDI